MAHRVHNFYAGPAALPWEVVKKTAELGITEFDGQGMSVMEISHRSKPFDGMFKKAQSNMLKIMGLSEEDYAVLFLGGGASTQFFHIPFNFLREGMTADYVNTGVWSKKAIKEAKYFGNVNIAASSEDKLFSCIPKEFNFTPGAAYVHTTSNNTIYGTEIWNFPETGSVPLICDMSSDFLSHPVDFTKFSLIYAGAQKNIGPSGCTAVVIRRDFAETAREDLPTMVNYRTHIGKDSLFNTPPSLPVFVIGLVMEWILENGGLEGIYDINKKKADLLYGAIDNSDGFYKAHVTDVASRSFMNVTFRLGSEELEKKFIAEGAEKGLMGLKGHRSVGGCRASTYNAVSYQSVEALVDFMKAFKAAN
ncbi:3-phosphoserine/phosphohydroxythreonine aminotransferase [Candidatus Fermentibacteria bacterium]|nr:MAG: 3-phosphoserine/phosphohydroxythreonine aminotransferase [Candidatus Fermentibacteria bacterium]